MSDGIYHETTGKKMFQKLIKVMSKKYSIGSNVLIGAMYEQEKIG